LVWLDVILISFRCHLDRRSANQPAVVSVARLGWA